MSEQEVVGSEPAARTVVLAAGAVLWRHGTTSPEVAVVHRPRYDDWSLPKGKLRTSETTQGGAAREITEETGFSGILSRLLHQSEYPVRGPKGEPATKLVDYFAARADGGEFSPNAEVDELHWLSVDSARARLSYSGDVPVLDAFASFPTDLITVLLVRHAKAGNRSEWFGDDNARPLSESGQRQSAALGRLLPLFGPRRIHVAPRLRCEQTVAPAAADLDITMESEPRLSEEGYWPDPTAGVERFLRIADGDGTPVICSQGGVIPDLVARLAETGSVRIPEIQSRKGSVWTLSFERIQEPNTTAQRLRLVGADYLPDPTRPGTRMHVGHSA